MSELDDIRDDYSDVLKNGERGKYAERIAREGMTITVKGSDGTSTSTHYPPGTRPSAVKRVHVYWVGGRWLVKTEGASRAFRRVQTEDEALRVGVALARKSGADLIVHAISTGRTVRRSA